MSDPFDSASRAADLRTAAQEAQREAFGLLETVAADILSRGLASVGCHPVVGKVFELVRGKIVDKALAFDERAAQYRLKQQVSGGKCENPYGEEAKQQLVEFVTGEIHRLPKWIRSSSVRRVWMATNQQHEDDVCRHHIGRAVGRIRSEYGKRRAEFDSDCMSLGTMMDAASNSKSRGGAPPADLLTTDELARLAMVEPKTLHNKLSEGRKSIDPQARPPESAIKGGGQTPDSYSYADIRDWLLFTWPTKPMRFPKSFDEVKRILAANTAT